MQDETSIYELRSLKPKIMNRTDAELLDTLDLRTSIEQILKDSPNFSDKNNSDWQDFNKGLCELIYLNNSPHDILRILLEFHEESVIKYSLSANFLYALKNL